jgi:predicted RNA methylase
MTLRLHRPDPVLRHHAYEVDAGTPPHRVAARLLKGKRLLVIDRYGTGADILDALAALLPSPGTSASYVDRRAHERAYREAALRLLVPIRGHRMALEGAADIGFLALLYPELDRFDLPLVEVQDLLSAWRLYDKGVHMAVLGHRLHPFYGTYAPTRTSHLELFATWLSGYQGQRGSAVDVGTGCGVLALMLRKAGFGRILATDDNPNAVESVRRELERLGGGTGIEPCCCDLLGQGNEAVDLVVFNPPWIKGGDGSLLDRALYFEEGLFERFFDQAAERIGQDGRVVLLFSTVLNLVQPEVEHPIEAELARGRFALVSKLSRKVKPSKGEDGKKRRTKEKVEVWELSRRGAVAMS